MRTEEFSAIDKFFTKNGMLFTDTFRNPLKAQLFAVTIFSGPDKQASRFTTYQHRCCYMQVLYIYISPTSR